MPAEIGTAYVKILPSTKGISKGISDGISAQGGSFEKAGSKIGAKLAKGIKVAAAAGGGALTGFTAMLIKETSSVEQQLGGSEAVFEKYANKLKKISLTAGSQMGLSQNSFLETANKMGSLFQGSGVKVKSAADMSAKAMQRAADVASIMGVDNNFAMESIAGMAKGNFTMMDNLGVKMTQTSLAASDAAKALGKPWKEMTEAEKVQIAYEEFMQKTAKYAGNYAKENETLAGSFTSLKANISTLLGQIGTDQDYTGTLDQIKGNIKQLAEAVIPVVKKVIPALKDIFVALAPELKEIAKTIAQPIIDGVKSYVTDKKNWGKIALAGVIGGAIGISKLGGIGGLFGGIGGKAAGAGMQGFAGGLKAFADPRILIGAGILSGSIAVISAGVGAGIWVFEKIAGSAIPSLLTEIGAGLRAFDDLNGANLANVGIGLLGLGAGVAAFAAGNSLGGIDAIKRFDGAAVAQSFTPIMEFVGRYSKEDFDKLPQFGGGVAAMGLAMIAQGVGEAVSAIGGVVSAHIGSGIEQLPDKYGKIMDFLRGYSNADFVKLPLFAAGMAAFGAAMVVEGVGEIISSLGSAVTAHVGGGIELLPDKYGKIMDFLRGYSNADFVKLPLFAAGMAAFGAAMVVEGVGEVISSLSGVLSAHIGSGIERLPDKYGKVMDFLRGYNITDFDKLVKFGGAVAAFGAAMVVEGAGDIAASFSSMISSLLGGGVEKLPDKWSPLIDWVKGIDLSTIEKLSPVVGAISTFAAAVSSIKTAGNITVNVTDIKNAISELSKIKPPTINPVPFTSYSVSLKAVMNDISGQAKKNIDLSHTTIQSALKRFGSLYVPPSDFSHVGKQIATGIGTGFSSAWITVSNGIRTKVQSLATQARQDLKIQSPSKVFAEIGKNVSLGLAEGIGSVQASEPQLERLNYDYQPRTPQGFPDRITLVDADGSILARAKVIAQDKIVRNNLNLGLV